MTKSVTLEKRLNSPDGTHNIFHFIKERRNFRENSHITKKNLDTHEKRRQFLVSIK